MMEHHRGREMSHLLWPLRADQMAYTQQGQRVLAPTESVTELATPCKSV